jgi:DNA-binding CsgD family transcriptional regulator
MVVGRVAERARIAEVLDAARHNRGAALVLLGPPGIGKTTLVDDAAQVTDMTVLRTAGSPAEQQLSWAGLHRLLRPLTDRLDDLPGAQRTALRAALALESGAGSPDRLAVAAGVLSVLADAARRAPLLVVVEDLQWLDRPSADAIMFAARRIGCDPVAVLVTCRDDEGAQLLLHGLPALEVQGLEPQEGLDLLSRDHPSIRRRVAEVLVVAAAGHPLGLLEAARALTPDQAVGAAPLPDPLPTGRAVELLYRSRLEQLPERTRLAVLVAALAGPEEARAVTTAWEGLGLGPGDVEPAEVVGLVALGAHRLAFRHPLVVAAVRSLADPVATRRAHAALAAALTPRSGSAVWHRAAAATEPDGDLAATLADMARRELGSAPQVAERAFARAAELATEPRLRGEFLLAAAGAAAETASGERAMAFLEEALPLLVDPAARAEAQHLSARLLIQRGAAVDAALALADGAEAVRPHDPDRAARMLADAVEPWLFAGEPQRAYAAAEQAAHIAAGRSGRLRVEVGLRLADVHAWQGRLEDAVPVWRSVAELVESSAELAADPWTRYLAGEARFSAGDDRQAAEHMTAAVARAQEIGATTRVPYMSIVLVWALCRLGDLDTAASTAADGLALASALGNVGDEAWGLAALAWVDALRGDELSCRRHAADAQALATSLGMRGLEAAEPALGMLELSRGRHDAAVAHLERAVAEHEKRGAANVGAPRMLLPLLVEAHARAGRTAVARERLAEFAAAADRVGHGPSIAAVERCHGLLEDDDRAVEHFERAVVLHQAADHRFELARSQLCYGERLRRMRRRADARIQLRAAEEAFAEMGAALWQARAWEELAASGERRRAADESERDRLTPQEMQVARLVSTGSTNREVAAQLFLSEKTIEAHLGRIFRKLGIRSRTALAAALAEPPRLREIPDSTGVSRA